ncbi:phage tail fiber protein [Klebsiella pneumoniae]|uniref:phage tail fiber domain-containing protein n=1 Tax=Klebsiella pneumoniae TaxID=573 RepID=UPI00209BD1E5|nr:phage tail fiber protein [Klebsiella pneumoniae]
MSVPNQIPYNIYTANGQTTVFTYEFYIISASDLEVSINGSVVTSGYTVSGVGNKDGGDITFLTPPANGAVVMLERVVPTYRLTDYQDNGDLLADTVNKDFDRIWMAIQRAFIDLGFALTRPYFGGPFDAKGYRIANLANPVNGQDAATKSYVDSTGAANLRYTVRFPEMVEPMPGVQFRANSLQGYNAQGKPVPVFSMTDTADLALKLASFTGAGLVGYKFGLPYPADTVGRKLNNWIFVEEFADENSAADDWTTALKNALIFAVNNNIRDVYAGDLTLGDTVKLDASTFSNIHLHARSVKPGANWPANSTLWDAKSMFQLGAASGQVVSFVLDIEKVDGGGIANYVEPVGNGMAYGKIKFGLITRCVRPFAMGKQTWPNASVMVEGDDLAYNWVGGHIERGTSGTTPISEGWNFSVRFNHGNRYGGWLIRNGGQYAKFGFGDMDYNGGWLSVLQVSTLSGISRGASVSNGTTTCEVLCYYTHQGANYVALMENRSVAGGNSSYSVGDTISGAGYTGTVTGVTTAATNSSGNNYFDLIHDFQGSAFGKVSVFGGYCGGVIGGSQFSSDLMFHNSFDGRALNLRGLGVSESGTILSLYRKAESNTAVVNITDDYFNISKRLFMRYRMIEGTPVATTLPKSPAAFKTVYTFSDSATDKYLAEGSMYEVTVKGNYPDAWARFVIFVMGNSIRMVSDDHDTDVFAWQFSGLSLQMRQNAQDVIQIAINIRRV